MDGCMDKFEKSMVFFCVYLGLDIFISIIQRRTSFYNFFFLH
jgi:hypothetical protein